MDWLTLLFGFKVYVGIFNFSFNWKVFCWFGDAKLVCCLAIGYDGWVITTGVNAKTGSPGRVSILSTLLRLGSSVQGAYVNRMNIVSIGLREIFGESNQIHTFKNEKFKFNF